MNPFYRGRPAGGEDVAGPCEVEYVAADGTVVPLPHVVVHSPTGFQWGYGGSGPADLALSLLCHAAGLTPPDGSARTTERAMREFWQERYDVIWARHQGFKRTVVARLPMGEPWSLWAEEVVSAAV